MSLLHISLKPYEEFYEVGTIFITILQLRYREVKRPAQRQSNSRDRDASPCCWFLSMA